MAGPDKHSRTERPTGRKVSEAKKKGSVPRSVELTSTVTLLTAVITLYTVGGHMISSLQRQSIELLGGMAAIEVTQAGVYSLMLKLFFGLAVVLAPYLLIVIVAAIVVAIAQEQVTFSWERMRLDFTKLNPVGGLSKLFNRDSIVEIVKCLLKIAIVGWIAYRVLRDEVANIAYLVEDDVQGIFSFVSHIAFKLILHTCGVLLVLAVFDLIYVKWRFLDNLKMTKQEVKDEHRQQEGDPHIKRKIKQLQFAQARRRMRKIIPTADVVITNPTHYAVALKYDRVTMAAPTVLAKGVDELAQRIKEIAREHKVVLVENRPLARELYAEVKEGQEIPETLYAAVAEVLAYVYSLKGNA